MNWNTTISKNASKQIKLLVKKIYNKTTTADGNFSSSFIYKRSGPTVTHKRSQLPNFKSGQRCEAVHVNFPFPSYKTTGPFYFNKLLAWRNHSDLKRTETILPHKQFLVFWLSLEVFTNYCAWLKVYKPSFVGKVINNMRSICLCKKSSLPGKDDTYEIIVEDEFQILLHRFYSSFKIVQDLWELTNVWL